MAGRVLIVDDEAGIRDALELLLEQRGYEAASAARGEAALERLQREEFSLVLSDVAMPGMDGIALAERIRRSYPDLPVIMISAHGELETAVRAVRAGAYDYLLKPIDEERLFLTMERALEWKRLYRDYGRLRGEVDAEMEMLGESPAMRRLREEIARAAPSDSRILILGEHGSGKELVARAIHEQSRRREGPFVKVNSAAIPHDLIESELFGHEPGSFTGATKQRKGRFEQADGGTLFLDEIADMAAEAQGKLLRVLSTGEVERVGGSRAVAVNVRLLSATNRDLLEEVREGAFREDLYHRLAVIPIRVPPLRERGDDILLLARRFLERFSSGYRERPPVLEPEADDVLRQHPWPGNVRELRNLMERIAIMHEGVRVGAAEVGAWLPAARPEGAAPAEGEDASTSVSERWKSKQRREEKELLQETLRDAGWNVTLAAEKLGIDRASLHRKMRRMGIARPGRRPSGPA
jgi:two-component system nitrogen regulation response regulator NtrX